MKRTPLKAKRERPRRKSGRVEHKRMKDKATRPPTAEERAHMDRVASLGCLVSGRPAVIHHVMHAPGKRCRRDHRFVVPLAPEFHNMGDHGVHGKHCGSEEAFLALWGVDLVSWCMEAWAHRNAPDASFWRDSVTRCRETAFPVLCGMKAGGRAPRTNKALHPALDQPLDKGATTFDVSN